MGRNIADKLLGRKDFIKSGLRYKCGVLCFNNRANFNGQMKIEICPNLNKSKMRKLIAANNMTLNGFATILEMITDGEILQHSMSYYVVQTLLYERITCQLVENWSL